jgi:hypothetical protein
LKFSRPSLLYTRRIVVSDAEQNQESHGDFSRDAAIHSYTRAAYTLDNGSHCSLKNFCCWQDFSD